MNASRMKNMIVLKDLPSNLVDEAIVILKKGNRFKKIEDSEEQNGSHFAEDSSGNYEVAIKEAEFLIQEYIQKLEEPMKGTIEMRKMHLKYKKLQICSLLLGITTIIGIMISIWK